MPPLVIVCGPPAVGKTILATALGEQLGMPVISKDLVKEAMMDHLGGAPAVGAAAFAVEFAIARELLKSEIGVILEGAFFRDQAEITELAALGDPIVLNLSCSLDVLEQRYIERHGLRHPSHRGLEAVPDLRARIEAGSYGVPELHGSALSVVTTRGFEPPEEEDVRWVREQIAAMSRSTRGGDNQGPIRDEPVGRIDSELIWEQQTPEWIQWARKPGHDSYWRFGRSAFFELLPPPGRLTVDLGCGEGRVSRDLVARGHRVISIDASAAMVRAAVTADPSIPALVADAANLPLATACCDLVIAYMSLHDMHDMEGAVLEAARVLETGGHLCMAVVHPINSAGQFAGRESNAPFVIQGSYSDAHAYIDRVDRDGLRMTFASHHYPIEGYFAAFERAGFMVEALREVRVDEASTQAEPSRERWRRLPLFLNLRAVRR